MANIKPNNNHFWDASGIAKQYTATQSLQTWLDNYPELMDGGQAPILDGGQTEYKSVDQASYVDFDVTFTTAFAHAPVVCGCIGMADWASGIAESKKGNYGCLQIAVVSGSVTTTGCKFRVYSRVGFTISICVH